LPKPNTINIPDREDNKRILVVDDDPDVTFVFETALETHGFFVNTHNDPVKALLDFKIRFYDLLLIDIKMPQPNGFELVKMLRKKDPGIKVCFMTSFKPYYNAMKNEHPTLDVRCFIKKPIEVKDLLSAVQGQFKSLSNNNFS
jgi:DNA-binding NtrC family response regulator